jgi:hypothetical protein
MMMMMIGGLWGGRQNPILSMDHVLRRSATVLRGRACFTCYFEENSRSVMQA